MASNFFLVSFHSLSKLKKDEEGGFFFFFCFQVSESSHDEVISFQRKEDGSEPEVRKYVLKESEVGFLGRNLFD